MIGLNCLPVVLHSDGIDEDVAEKGYFEFGRNLEFWTD